MQGDAVAFGIDDDGAVAVRADGEFGLEHVAVVLLDGVDGVVQADIYVQIN